jgi:hypothetical protein
MEDTMLLVIEILFLILGLWAIISGKFPKGLFKLMFGKGEYDYPPTQTRLFGLFLASPLPIALLVTFLLVLTMGSEGAEIAPYVELFYVIIVVIVSIIIARKTRKPETAKVENAQSVSLPSDEKKLF